MMKTTLPKPLSVEAFERAATIAMLRDSYHLEWGVGDRAQREAELKDDIQQELGKQVKVSSGCYRSAVIFEDFVVKFPRDCRFQEMYAEAAFIKRMQQTEYARHFPITELVELTNCVVLIQEKVDMNHRDKDFAVRSAATRLADHLGISDMHEGNFGWKGPKGREYPVFIDVDIRYGASSEIPAKPLVRSWMV